MPDPPEDGPSVKEIHHVSVKMPEIFPSDPELWFDNLESQFAISNITRSITKYHYVNTMVGSSTMMKLPRDCRSSDRSSTNGRDPYEYIKSEILKVMSPSKPEVFDQMFAGRGDSSVFSYYLKMESLIDNLKCNSVDDLKNELFKHLIIKQVPTNQANILTSQRETHEAKDLARLADEVLASSSAEVPIMGASSNSSKSHQGKKDQKSKNFKNSRHKPGNSSKKDKLCPTHERYGHRAWTCTSPSVCPKLMAAQAPIQPVQNQTDSD